MQLIIATRNAHKLAEVKSILSLSGLLITGTEAWPNVPDPIEDGDTFIANATIKARVWAQATGHWALADDSGLTVDALNGAPGINSARYAGEHGNDTANNAKLLADMAGESNRCAHFVCALALCSPNGEVTTLQAQCDGILITEDRGHGGFGYDPLFQPQGHTETFAQLPQSTKDALSHRGKALRLMIPTLTEQVLQA